jgi:hypothetical protein
VFARPDGDDRPIEELLADPEMQEAGPAPVAVAFAPPGEMATALADLDPGSYYAACFIPVGGAEDGPPHAMEGMIAEFTVR